MTMALHEQKNDFEEESGILKVMSSLGETIYKQLSDVQKISLMNYVNSQRKRYQLEDVYVQLQWIITIARTETPEKRVFPDNSDRGINNIRSRAHNLKHIRNKSSHHSHRDPANHGDAWRAADEAVRLLEALGLSSEQMEKLRLKFPSPDSPKPSNPLGGPSHRLPDSTKQIAVITCTAGQNPNATSANDLYIGPFYTRSKEEAQKDGLPFLIFSTKYGLISPEEKNIKPYNRNFEKMTEQEKQELSDLLERQVKEKISSKGFKKIVFLAGGKYREFLREILKRNNITCKTHGNWRKICDSIYGRDNA